MENPVKCSHSFLLFTKAVFKMGVQRREAASPEWDVLSHSVVSNSLRPQGLEPSRLLCPWGFAKQEFLTVGCHFLLQGIFPTQGSNPGLSYCRWVLYRLSHQDVYKSKPTCDFIKFVVIKSQLPCSSVVKNLPANAGNTGLTLIREDLRRCGETKPMRHNHWACAPQQEKPPQKEARITTKEEAPPAPHS